MKYVYREPLMTFGVERESITLYRGRGGYVKASLVRRVFRWIVRYIL